MTPPKALKLARAHRCLALSLLSLSALSVALLNAVILRYSAAHAVQSNEQGSVLKNPPPYLFDLISLDFEPL